MWLLKKFHFFVTMRYPVGIMFLLLLLNVRAQEPALIGYYAGDGSRLSEHHVEYLTHLIWCFAHVVDDSMHIAPEQYKVIRGMVDLKARNPRLKVLLSMGGWGGCANCSAVFSREEGRSLFAKSVKHQLEITGTDGIDLDWEYPAVQGPPGHAFSDADRRNFTLLLTELRKELGNRYEITFAAGGTDECLLRGFEWNEVIPLMDRVHLMSYDLHHGYSTSTGHHTALYSTAEQTLSAQHSVDLLIGQGVPRSKIVIGSAFYSRIWKQVPPDNNGLHRTGTFSHSVPYHSMDSLITPSFGWRFHIDREATASYAYNAAEKLFITFDDPMSVAAKAGYVRRERLGGIMFWQLADDRPVDGLLDAMYRALRTR